MKKHFLNFIIFSRIKSVLQKDYFCDILKKETVLLNEFGGGKNLDLRFAKQMENGIRLFKVLRSSKYA